MRNDYQVFLLLELFYRRDKTFEWYLSALIATACKQYAFWRRETSGLSFQVLRMWLQG